MRIKLLHVGSDRTFTWTLLMAPTVQQRQNGEKHRCFAELLSWIQRLILGFPSVRLALYVNTIHDVDQSVLAVKSKERGSSKKR